jgi:hypothetical protein
MPGRLGRPKWSHFTSQTASTKDLGRSAGRMKEAQASPAMWGDPVAILLTS